jgi:hypothetical protein
LCLLQLNNRAARVTKTMNCETLISHPLFLSA